MAGKTVEFLVSPTGRFLLAYNVGDVATLGENQAQEVIDAGYAKLVEKDLEQEAKAKQEAEEKAKAEQEAKANAKTGK
ncbi:hypothetical protein [Flavobacterium anhuiense]|uniref:hypothetical protein n=1 Tax=Flavobacterium anhuiense TaxID=459526 RepID=UPI000E6B9788|nr:hypothetical protein [Flavobacterium anhuiense]